MHRPTQKARVQRLEVIRLVIFRTLYGSRTYYAREPILRSSRNSLLATAKTLPIPANQAQTDCSFYFRGDNPVSGKSLHER